MPKIYFAVSMTKQARAPLPALTEAEAEPAGREVKPTPVANEPVSTFLANKELLFYIGTKWYGLPRSEMEPLVQDICLTYLERHEVIRDLRPWLIGAAIRSCRTYWHQRRKSIPLPEDAKAWPDPEADRFPDQIVDRLTINKAFAKTSERCREALLEKFVEERTLREIAGTWKTTENYAKKIVYTCLKEFRSRYRRMTRKRP